MKYILAGAKVLGMGAVALTLDAVMSEQELSAEALRECPVREK